MSRDMAKESMLVSAEMLPDDGNEDSSLRGGCAATGGCSQEMGSAGYRDMLRE